MEKQVISVEGAPKAIGPYSSGVKVGGTLYLAGQIPIDPATNKMITGDIQAQTKRVLDNIGALVKGAGMNFDNVVKVTVYLSDMNDFSKMNEIYAEYFKGKPPARVCIQAARLPKDASIEIDAIAVES